jgi:excisionase family DNA binding protein
MALLTIYEVADRLRIEHHTVRKYIRHGKIKAVNYGRRYRVDEAEVTAFLERSETTKQEAKTA